MPDPNSLNTLTPVTTLAATDILQSDIDIGGDPTYGKSRKIEFQNLFNASAAPILNAVADLTALNALPTANLQTGALCAVVAMQNRNYYWDGSAWQPTIINHTKSAAPTASDDVNAGYLKGDYWFSETGSDIYFCADNAASAAVWTLLSVENLEWTSVPAFNSNWTSTAQVAKFDNGKLVVMHGKFTSNVNNNSDPCGTFPAGYEGIFSKAVSVNKSGSQENIHNEDITWSGGAVNYVHSVPHILVTDDVQVTVKDKGTENNYSVVASCVASAIDLEAQNAPTSNDLIVYAKVFRDNPVFTCDMGTDGSDFGIGPNLNNGDWVWANIVYDVKQNEHVTPNLVIELNNGGVTVAGTPFQVFLGNEAGTWNWQQMGLGTNIAYGGLPAGNYTALIVPATVEGSDTNTYNAPSDFPVVVSSNGQNITFTYTQA